MIWENDEEKEMYRIAEKRDKKQENLFKEPPRGSSKPPKESQRPISLTTIEEKLKKLKKALQSPGEENDANSV